RPTWPPSGRGRAVRKTPAKDRAPSRAAGKLRGVLGLAWRAPLDRYQPGCACAVPPAGCLGVEAAPDLAVRDDAPFGALALGLVQVGDQLAAHPGEAVGHRVGVAVELRRLEAGGVDPWILRRDQRRQPLGARQVAVVQQ